MSDAEFETGPVRPWWEPTESERAFSARLDAAMKRALHEADTYLHDMRPDLTARADAGDEAAQEEIDNVVGSASWSAAMVVMGEFGMHWELLDPAPDPPSEN